MGKNILAIHAHPDDLEFLAGGTLAHLSTAGHNIAMVSMTPGDCGSHELPPEEIAAVRQREAAASARRIGAVYHCAGFTDLAVFSDDPSRRRVTEIIRRFRPDLVLTASPVDYMADHEAASQLVRDACFGAPAPNYATGQLNPAPALPSIPHLYFTDPLGGVDREGRPITPDFYVDVSATLETKRAMLSEHASQRTWLLQQHRVDDYIQQMERWTQACGRRAGLPAAEGFRRYKGHPYPESPLLEDLLGGCVVRVSS